MNVGDDSPIQLYLNDALITLESVEPTLTVLNYLRNERRLTGTKEGCAEGDCGACTVVIGQLINKKLQMRAVNACIQFVATLDAKALYTVEYLRQNDGTLHPVQQAMVDCHGSQCGFCTPGFVMSLWNVYTEHQQAGTKANNQQIRTALSGNLCRCTGYKPILQAGDQMFDLDPVVFDNADLFSRLQKLQRTASLKINANKTEYYAPRSLAELTQLKSDYTDATLLAGGTDVGLWVNKQFRDLGTVIYLGNVKELQQIERDDKILIIGAAVSLENAFEQIATYYPQIKEQWLRFASVPIRNAGTLGGNIANGSPIGDSMPWLIAIGAQVTLASTNANRTMPLEDLYIDYMKKSMREDEVLLSITVPFPKPEQVFRTYKLSKRYDSDISAVCAAFALHIKGAQISDARIAFGGMAATPKRADSVENFLVGRSWDEETAEPAIDLLKSDYTPLGDMRASAENRMASAQNLLRRFYLETNLEAALSEEQVSVFTDYPKDE